jgi:hypothetical protein
MRKISLIVFLFIIGLFILPDCKKITTTIVPITLTDKSGNIFIQIDTASKSFDAYCATKIKTGLLKGVFNDSVMSSFYLALTTKPYWDTVYHPADTTIFPTHYTHVLNVQNYVDLTNYSSPYHFLLLGLDSRGLDVGTYKKLTIVVTVTPE